MKKILVLSCLLISTLSAFAINLSLSDGDFDMNANVTREDNNLRMQYKIKGMNSVSNITEIPEDQKQAISQVGDVNFDILASCSESKVKVLSMQIYDLTGKVLTEASDSEWIPIEKKEDIIKLKELCDKI